MPATDPFAAKYLEILTASAYLAPVLRPGRPVAAVSYYAYNGRVGSDAVPLANGVPQTFNVETQADSDFVLTFITAALQPTAGGAFQYNGNVAWQITDLSTGKPLFSADAAIALTSGAGGFPFVLPAPRVYGPNTTIAVKVTNHDAIMNAGNGPVGLYFALHGSRVYYAQ